MKKTFNCLAATIIIFSSIAQTQNDTTKTFKYPIVGVKFGTDTVDLVFAKAIEKHMHNGAIVISTLGANYIYPTGCNTVVNEHVSLDLGTHGAFELTGRIEGLASLRASKVITLLAGAGIKTAIYPKVADYVIKPCGIVGASFLHKSGYKTTVRLDYNTNGKFSIGGISIRTPAEDTE